jgi:hypothetical protein
VGALVKLAAILVATAFALVANSVGSLLAQADIGSVAAPGWISVIVQLGSFGLISYLIISGLPTLQREMSAERKAERADFSAALGRQIEDAKLARTDFSTAIKVVTDFARTEVESIRAAAKLESEAMRVAFMAEQRDTRQAHARQMEWLNKLYVDSVGAMRTAVHDVRDVANVVTSKAALAVEVAKVTRGDPQS